MPGNDRQELKSLRIKVLFLGLLVAVVLLAAAIFDSVPYLMAAATAVLQLLFAFSWPRMAKADAPVPSGIIIALCALAATAAAELLPEANPMAHAIEVITVGVLLAFISQVLRGADATARLEGAVSTVTGVVIAVLGSAWAASAHASFGLGLAASTLAGLLGAGLIAVTKLGHKPAALLAPLLGAGFGAAASLLPIGIDWVPALAAGLVSGLVLTVLRSVAIVTRGSRGKRGVAGLTTGAVLLAGAANWYLLDLLVFV